MNFDQFLLKKYRQSDTSIYSSNTTTPNLWFSKWQNSLSPDDWKNLADEFADECVKKAK